MKKRGPIRISSPVSQSETLGKSVPQKTTARMAMNTQLLRMNPDSRETTDSSLFVLRSCGLRQSSTPKKAATVSAT